MNKIKDFGKKIGGAKKDLWKEREFNVSDLDDLSDRESFKYAIKDNIWKKPNYEELSNTRPITVVYFIKKIRDALPAKVTPLNNDEKNRFNIKTYIELVEKVRNSTMTVLNELDLTFLFDRIFVKNGYYSNRSWTSKATQCYMLTNKLVKATNISRYDISTAKRKIEKNGGKLTSMRKEIYVSKRDDGKGYDIIKPEKYMNLVLNREPFKTEEEAQSFIENEIKTIAKKFKRPELKQIFRTGTQFRNASVTTDMILDTFGFRGGEFGNWCSDVERQLYINYAFDAFMDLSEALNISPKDISLNKELAIAFGARGSGNAMAHYEPSRIVINLTKTKGAGCFAHEWGHALDDFVGRLSGNIKIAPDGMPASKHYLSNFNSKLSKNIIDSFNNVVKLMLSKEANTDEKKEAFQKEINRSISYAKSWIDPIVKNFKEAQINHRGATPEEISKMDSVINDMFTGKIKDTHEFNELYKSIKGKRVDKKYIENIDANLHWLNVNYNNLANVSDAKYSTETNYLKYSEQLDKGRKTPYYSTVVEMFARAFEGYVQDTIYSKGNRSDYLVHNADNKAYAPFKLYPEDEERQKINNGFNELFKVLRKEKIFSEDSLKQNLIMEEKFLEAANDK